MARAQENPENKGVQKQPKRNPESIPSTVLLLQEYLALAKRRLVDIVHLIYKRKRYESQAKGYQLSRSSMEERERTATQM